MSVSVERIPDGFVSSAVAAARLRISDRTLRRRVAAGHIEGEYLPRPQGSILVVRLPDGTGSADGAGEPPQERSGSAPLPPESPDGTAGPTGSSAAVTRLLDALDARDEAFTSLHAAYARVYGELAEQRERAGRAEASSEMLLLMLADVRAQLERERQERQARPRWWPW